jgi:hypothetical protein
VEEVAAHDSNRIPEKKEKKRIEDEEKVTKEKRNLVNHLLPNVVQMLQDESRFMIYLPEVIFEITMKTTDEEFTEYVDPTAQSIQKYVIDLVKEQTNREFTDDFIKKRLQILNPMIFRHFINTMGTHPTFSGTLPAFDSMHLLYLTVSRSIVEQMELRLIREDLRTLIENCYESFKKSKNEDKDKRQKSKSQWRAVEFQKIVDSDQRCRVTIKRIFYLDHRGELGTFEPEPPGFLLL